MFLFYDKLQSRFHALNYYHIRKTPKPNGRRVQASSHDLHLGWYSYLCCPHP